MKKKIIINTLRHEDPEYFNQESFDPEPSGIAGEAEYFLSEEDGVGVVEIILILVVLISLVIIFKKQLTSLVTSILSKITSQSESI